MNVKSGFLILEANRPFEKMDRESSLRKQFEELVQRVGPRMHTEESVQEDDLRKWIKKVV